MLTVSVKISKCLAMDPKYFSLFWEFMKFNLKMELCLVITFCKGEKKAPSLKFIKIELENRLEHFFSNLGIQLQVALNFLSIH